MARKDCGCEGLSWDARFVPDGKVRVGFTQPQACKVTAANRDHGLAGAIVSKDKMEMPWKQVAQAKREGDLS